MVYASDIAFLKKSVASDEKILYNGAYKANVFKHCPLLHNKHLLYFYLLEIHF